MILSREMRKAGLQSSFAENDTYCFWHSDTKAEQRKQAGRRRERKGKRGMKVLKKVLIWIFRILCIPCIGMVVFSTVVLSGPAMWVYLGILLIMWILGYWLSVSTFLVVIPGYYEPKRKQLLKATAILALPLGPMHVIGGLVVLSSGGLDFDVVSFAVSPVELGSTYLLGGIGFFVNNILYLRELFSKE